METCRSSATLKQVETPEPAEARRQGRLAVRQCLSGRFVPCSAASENTANDRAIPRHEQEATRMTRRHCEACRHVVRSSGIAYMVISHSYALQALSTSPARGALRTASTVLVRALRSRLQYGYIEPHGTVEQRMRVAGDDLWAERWVDRCDRTGAYASWTDGCAP